MLIVVSIETYHSWKFSSLLATLTTSMKIATKKSWPRIWLLKTLIFFFPLEVRYRKRNNSDEANVNVFICISGDKLWSKTMHCRPWFFQHNIASSCIRACLAKRLRQRFYLTVATYRLVTKWDAVFMHGPHLYLRSKLNFAEAEIRCFSFPVHATVFINTI